MENKPTEQPQKPPVANPHPRAAYSPPVLKVYGPVSQLTLGGGGSRGDGGGGLMDRA